MDGSTNFVHEPKIVSDDDRYDDYYDDRYDDHVEGDSPEIALHQALSRLEGIQPAGPAAHPQSHRKQHAGCQEFDLIRGRTQGHFARLRAPYLEGPSFFLSHLAVTS